MVVKNKYVESPLYVYKDGPSEPILIGVLDLISDPDGSFFAEFHYVSEYLEREDALPIDPINVPLADPSKKYSTSSRYHVLGSIFDAAPDAWGRKIISAAENVTQADEKTVLLRGHGMGVGELYFSAGLLKSRPIPPTVPHMNKIVELASPIAKMDEDAVFDPAWESILVGSWDLGGARPKAVVCDDMGDYWIAKFPRKNETYDRQRVEWANLEMARDIGMNVPDHLLIDTPHGAVLLVKRFDRQGTNKKHFLSAASLISPSPSIDKRSMDAPIGKATFSYARIADVIRRISANPAHDLQELFARMVFNVAIHNTDDHLKNTGFTLSSNENSYGYELSPLFDVVTQEGSLKHMLHIGARGRESSFENVLSEIPQMRIKPATAEIILNKVMNVFHQREAYYRRAGMSAREIHHVENCLSAWHIIESQPAPVSAPTARKRPGLR